MNPKEALRLLGRYSPCPHEAWEHLGGTGEPRIRCLDCSSEFDPSFRKIVEGRAADFDRALSCLADQVALLQGIRDALGNGADEEAWPPGLNLPGAIRRLRGERGAVVAYLLRDYDTDASRDAAAEDIRNGEHRIPVSEGEG